MSPLFGKSKVRQVRYRITDPYFRFWLRFISPVQMQTLAEAGQRERMVGIVDKALATYLGRKLEDWFIRQTIESGRWNLVGGCWDANGLNEIDLAAVNREEKSLER